MLYFCSDAPVYKQVMNKIIKGQKAINVSELSRIATSLGTTTDDILSVDAANAIEAKDWLSFMGQIINTKKCFTEYRLFVLHLMRFIC